MYRLPIRTKGLLVALLLLVSAVPTVLLDTGDGVECDPVCDSCHYAHDRVYHAYLDIDKFEVPSSLDGSEVKRVEVRTRLHGNVGLGYTMIGRGWLELTSNEDRVAIEDPHQDFISYEPGFKSFYWNVSGRLAGFDTLHVDVYGLGVHLSVEFREQADSGQIVVTNPVNAAPRVGFTQPDGYADTADTQYMVALDLEDPNADHLAVDLYYDNDTDRSNGQTQIVSGLIDPDTYLWNTRSLPAGWYWLHADVDDQRGGQAQGTSEHMVIVSHGNQVPYVELQDPPIPTGSPPEPYVIRDPVYTFKWFAEDGDGDRLTYEFWVGREVDHMELVGTTNQRSFDYAPDDNARLLWMVIPRDGKVRGWCRGGPRPFRTEIAYPVEVDLILPADGATVMGPDVKLVWYGRDLDFEQVLYDVFVEKDGVTTKVADDWDDPAGPVLVLSDLEPGTTYTWWVEGDNPYSPKGVSQRWTFTVATTGLPMVVLQPEDFSDGVVTLSWSPSPEGTVPVSYDLHLVDELDGERVVLQGTTLESLMLDGLMEDHAYHWYVMPVDAEGKEGFSVPAFSTFVYDMNTPPTASIPEPYVLVPPGTHVLRWDVTDPDGDQVTSDIYLDAQNGTAILAGRVTAQQYTVSLAPDLTYTWRVVPRDEQGVGVPAMGRIVTEGQGSSTPATGSLVSPPDGAEVPGPVVNLSWTGSDPLDRALLYDVHIDTAGGDPFLLDPVSVNVTSDWWTLELAGNETRVSWGVVVRPVRGPSTVIGSASFTVSLAKVLAPSASLHIGDGAPGEPVVVRALEVVTLNASGSSDPSGEPLEYWFEFGDGLSSGWTDNVSVEHTYLVEGQYNVTVIVRNPDGVESEPALVSLEVGPGKLGSDEDVPSPGALLSLLALALASLTFSPSRRRRAGGGCG